ncbi:hypothetical protein C0033_19355 [Clostridium sp. chh4-2]|uniref:LysR family transcriptional regulator n=1 Tax=Clostridium sp. chh4-2 TaxID=2067550 RepID=UPI000CCEFB48|nr:LysR family transcriptional regulator [Clostridium sp. chh4-2]PNV60433.1 hypothetical protein C0033_19355 [Clostridium sp. chh4-2]
MLLKEIRYVLAVAENDTVAKAADSLYLSQPALTKYIHNLEDSLNIKLFEKVGKTLRPTEYGKSYIEAAKRIQAIYTELEQDVFSLDEMIRGTLRIGTSRRGAYVLPNVLPAFSAKFPSVKVTLHEQSYDELDSMLVQGEIDIGMLKQPQELNPNITYLPLFSEELVLVISKDHPLCARAVEKEGCTYPWLDIRLFEKERFILYKPEHRNRFWVNKLFEEHHMVPNVFLDTNNIEGALYLAQKGCGACFAPELYAHNVLQLEGGTGSIRLFSVGEPVSRYQYFVAYRKNQHNTRYMAEFVNILLEYYSNK